MRSSGPDLAPHPDALEEAAGAAPVMASATRGRSGGEAAVFRSRSKLGWLTGAAPHEAVGWGRCAGLPAMSTRIAPGVVQIDTLLGGWGEVTAGYLVEGPEPCLGETGSQSSLPTVLAELDALGLGPADLATVVVTHIHLDHAGGVGDIAAAFPRATVLVHEKGARHLVDPDRLVRSAALVYGDLLDALYGRLTPTPADRVRVLGDGEEIRIGPGRTLTSIDSPGHAKHHLGLHDSESGLLFVGDAVGVRLPRVGVLRPATPPPDFDLDLALQSLQRFAARRPAAPGLAHYGVTPGDPLDCWRRRPRPSGAGRGGGGGVRDGRDIAAALTRRSRTSWRPTRRLEIGETLNGSMPTPPVPALAADRSGPMPSGGPTDTPSQAGTADAPTGRQRRPPAAATLTPTRTASPPALSRLRRRGRPEAGSSTSAPRGYPRSPARRRRRLQASLRQLVGWRSGSPAGGGGDHPAARFSHRLNLRPRSAATLVLLPLPPEAAEEGQDLVRGLLDDEVVEGLMGDPEEGEERERRAQHHLLTEGVLDQVGVLLGMKPAMDSLAGRAARSRPRTIAHRQ